MVSIEARNASIPVHEYPQFKSVLDSFFNLDEKPDPTNFHNNLANKSIAVRIGLLEKYAEMATGVKPLRVAEPFPNYQIDWVFWDDKVALEMAAESRKMLIDVISLASLAKEGKEGLEEIALTAVSAGNVELVAELLQHSDFKNGKSARPIYAMSNFIYLAINYPSGYTFTDKERDDAGEHLGLGIANLALELHARGLVYKPQFKNSVGTYHDLERTMESSVKRGVLLQFA